MDPGILGGILNHDAIIAKGVTLTAILNKAKTLLLTLEGIADVFTRDQLASAAPAGNAFFGNRAQIMAFAAVCAPLSGLEAGSISVPARQGPPITRPLLRHACADSAVWTALGRTGSRPDAGRGGRHRTNTVKNTRSSSTRAIRREHPAIGHATRGASGALTASRRTRAAAGRARCLEQFFYRKKPWATKSDRN